MAVYLLQYMTKEQASNLAAGLGNEVHKLLRDIYSYLSKEVCAELYLRGLVPHFTGELRRRLNMLSEGQFKGLTDVILDLQGAAQKALI